HPVETRMRDAHHLSARRGDAAIASQLAGTQPGAVYHHLTGVLVRLWRQSCKGLVPAGKYLVEVAYPPLVDTPAEAAVASQQVIEVARHVNHGRPIGEAGNSTVGKLVGPCRAEVRDIGGPSGNRCSLWQDFEYISQEDAGLAARYTGSKLQESVIGDLAPLRDAVHWVSLVGLPDGGGYVGSGIGGQVARPDGDAVASLEEAHATGQSRDATADHKDIHVHAPNLAGVVVPRAMGRGQISRSIASQSRQGLC